MNLQAEDEGRAMVWLATLPRTAEIDDNQIIIRIIPGTYCADRRAPLFGVSIRHPELKDRIRATGNTLFSAARHARRLLDLKGVDSPVISKS